MSSSATLLARLQYPLAALLLVLFLIVGWRGREPTMNAAGDDELVYLSLSKSLESGSYREVYKAGAPLHVQYPPAFPAWLVVIRHTLGESLERERLVNLLLAALALLVFFLAVGRLAGPELGLAVLGLSALNRSLLTTAALTSEGLFLLVVAGALALMLRAEPPGTRRVSGAIALALLAFLTRTIGLALVLAVGSWLWAHRRRLALAAWGASALLVVGGWFAYSTIARHDSAVRSYASEFAIGAHRSGSAVPRIAQRVWQHGVTYVTTHMPYALSLPSIPGTFVDNWAWLLVNVVLLTLGFVLLWQGWRAAAVYVFCYIALVLIWPWESARLLIPMIPLGFTAFLLGARRATRPLVTTPRKVVLAVLVALPAVGAIQGARERYSLYNHCDRSNPGPECYEQPRRALLAAADYVRRQATAREIVLTEQPASVSSLSGHPTEDTSLLPDLPPNRILEVLRARGIQFVFVSRPWMARALQPFCTKLRFVAGFLPDLLVVSTAAVPAAPDACPALAELASTADGHK